MISILYRNGRLIGIDGSFNEDKCKFMVFNNKYYTIDLTMNGKPLSRTDNERDLGIHISSDLKWNRKAGKQLIGRIWFWGN